VGDVRVAEEQAEGARRQLADAEAALRRGEQEIGDDEAVRRAVTAASCALLEQRTVVESLDAEIESLGPEAAELRVQRADKAVRAARAEHEKLRAETSELRGKLLAGDLLGLHERLGCARSALLAADAQAQRLTERVEAVRLLHETLERRHALARQALLEPLQREIAPLARLLMPRAAVRIDDGLGVASVTRKEHGEDEFESLGGGSREQFGLLVRLAMAKVLGGDEPLPVMLDDSLVFTSSLRFEGVANLLAHVARSLQVIVFTCHWDRFRPLGPDRAIDLEQAKSEAAERAGEREA
jgi:DNA repair exonuclease SbcCD ATPase subunit